MATPPIPASQSATVKAAEIRAGSSLYETNLDTVAKIVMGRREGWKDELLQLYKSVTTTRGELAKLGQDTFVELADLSKDYYKIASAGNVNPKDALDAYIKILGLEAKINKDMGTDDKQLVQNLTARADAIAPHGSPQWKAALASMYLDVESGSVVSPYRVGTYNKISELVAGKDGDLATATTDPRAAALAADVQQRKETAARLSSTAAVIKRDVGDLAKLQQIANSGNGDLIKQTAASVAPTLDQAMDYAKRFPGRADITARLKEDEDRIITLKNKLDEDPMLAIQSYIKSATKKEERDVDFYKTIGSQKFQRWAASNNLMVGKMRPATTEEDKTRVGYIPELNAVYEPGPDDQRALVVAHNQLQMRPGAQLFTRRGLEARRNVEVQLGTKGAEREVMVDASGKEVTPDQVRAKNKFVGKAMLDGKSVYVREDGSGYDGENQYTAQELAGHGAVDLSEAEAKSVSDKVTENELKSLTTKKVAGEATGVQTLRGRETAMLPTDPEDTLYVIETTDGRRVPIRESQLVKETEISNGAVAAPGATRLTEEPRMALRKPLAMLRARGAREKAEPPVGPLGRATEAGQYLLTPEELKAQGAKVVELPARAGGVAAGTGAAIPGIQQPLSARPSLRGEKTSVDDSELRRTAIEQSVVARDGAAKPTSEVGRDVRKAAGAEQTGKAAETVAASIPPIAMGTPKNVPTYEVTQGNTKYTVDATPMFTPAELAAMNKPETPAERKARVMREMRSKLGETPATEPMP